MGTSLSRRHVLAAIGAGGIALTTPAQGRADSSAGAVVFVYDDGPIEDYTQAFPAHQAFDAPASTGIVTEWIGRENFMGTDWMDLEHLRELEDAGWEILSHTTEHTALGTFALTADVEPSDRRIHVERNRHGYYRGKDLEITDGDHTVRRTVVDYGTDDVGQYIDLDEPLERAFAAEETVERYPADHMEEFLLESRRELESYGFDVDGILCPYDSCDDWTVEFVRQYYETNANANHGSPINDPGDYDPHETNRDYFIEFTTREAVKADLDEIAARDALGVIGAHTFKEEVTEDRIYETLQWVDDRGLEVLTLREAAERFGGTAASARSQPTGRLTGPVRGMPHRDRFPGPGRVWYRP
ncbi:polysaccharide deacetylase family protein [Natrononativus amylolyticus]|uniref:polysaccharide deacetylase family protein n=1 Tax=Natrononativus amylolyticus TaxID=2963434 RepID=UPI0020CC63E9|nr:polysaccharide deacetylase family protein [Natrononativus amylolyticus]